MTVPFQPYSALQYFHFLSSAPEVFSLSQQQERSLSLEASKNISDLGSTCFSKVQYLLSCPSLHNFLDPSDLLSFENKN